MFPIRWANRPGEETAECGLSSLPLLPTWGGLPLSVRGRDLAEDLALEEVVTYPSADFAQLPGKRGERPEPLKGLVFGERSCAARI